MYYLMRLGVKIMNDRNKKTTETEMPYIDIVETTRSARAGDQAAQRLIEARSKERQLANKKATEDEFPRMAMPA